MAILTTIQNLLRRRGPDLRCGDVERDELRWLLRQVLDAPANHKGHRSYDRGTTVRAYTAKRLDDDLLDKIKKAI